MTLTQPPVLTYLDPHLWKQKLQAQLYNLLELLLLMLRLLKKLATQP